MGTTGINSLLENQIRIEVEEKTLEKRRELNEQFKRDMQNCTEDDPERARIINRYGYELFRTLYFDSFDRKHY